MLFQNMYTRLRGVFLLGEQAAEEERKNPGCCGHQIPLRSAIQYYRYST
jgi:hypothetical protein